MEADLTEAVIARASDEHGVVRIGVLALQILAEAERARRIKAERHKKTLGKVPGEDEGTRSRSGEK